MNLSGQGRTPRVGVAALCMLAAALPAPAARAAAPAADPCTMTVRHNHLAADATVPGVISLRFYDHAGARVVFWECLPGGSRRLGSRRIAPDPATNPPATFQDAVRWSCDRLVRRFAAIATLPDGTTALGAYSVRTVSCRRRLELDVPRRASPRSRIRIRVIDRWGLGAVRPRLCVTPPGGRRSCRSLRLHSGVVIAGRRLRADRHGRWRVELRYAGHRVRRSIAVGSGVRSEAPAPIVLATGDSTMQGVDSFLADELGARARVRSDVRPASGVSRTHFWTRHARSQTRRLRQSVTVVSVGAATDAMPLPAADGTTAECCDAPWILAYSRRVRSMMRTYLRGGRARVFWLTPPLPRPPARRRITDAINVAVEHAARGLDGVVVGRVDRFFSPNGYSDHLRYRGRDVRVRELDGIHLNVAGTSILARLLAPAVRAALRRPGR